MTDDYFDSPDGEDADAEALAEQQELDAAIERERAEDPDTSHADALRAQMRAKAVADAQDAGRADNQNPSADTPESVDDMRERMMRALAEAENTRRRAERDKEDAYKYAVTRFARDMLAVGDNMRRALDSIDDATRAAGGEALDNLMTGISMTEREMLNVFEKHGIKQVNPEPGTKFDPNVHQAMAEVPGTGLPNKSVFQVTAPGYVIEDRLLRPAMVLVAKGDAGVAAVPTADEASGEDGDEPKPGSNIDTSA